MLSYWLDLRIKPATLGLECETPKRKSKNQTVNGVKPRLLLEAAFSSLLPLYSLLADNFRQWQQRQQRQQQQHKQSQQLNQLLSNLT